MPESDARSVMSVVSDSTRSDGSALTAVTNTGSHCLPSVTAILPAAVAHTERPTQCWQGNSSTDSQPRLETAVTILRKVLTKMFQWLAGESVAGAYSYIHRRTQINTGAWTWF